MIYFSEYGCGYFYHGCGRARVAPQLQRRGPHSGVQHQTARVTLARGASGSGDPSQHLVHYRCRVYASVAFDVGNRGRIRRLLVIISHKLNTSGSTCTIINNCNQFNSAHLFALTCLRRTSFPTCRTWRVWPAWFCPRATTHRVIQGSRAARYALVLTSS